MNKNLIKTPKLQLEFFRISNYLITDSIELIKDKTVENDELIHLLRKRIKNLRTILKLLRKEVGEEFYKKNNYLLRDINRRSASFRNYYALIKLVESTLSTVEDLQLKEVLSLLLTRLKSDFNDIRVQTDYSTLFSQYSSQLGKYQSHLKNLKGSENKFSVFKYGFTKLYKEGKDLLEVCLINSSDENLHELRKCSKDFYYITLSLSPIWKNIFEAFAKEIKRLSEVLGEVNDFCELTHYIQTLIDNPFDFSIAFDLIESRKQTLLSESFILGRKIYALDEDNFINLFKFYYLNYKKEL